MSVFYIPAESRPLCLVLSDDRTLPLRCRFKLAHDGDHDWQMETPGVALGDSEGECGATDVHGATGAADRVLETWEV